MLTKKIIFLHLNKKLKLIIIYNNKNKLLYIKILSMLDSYVDNQNNYHNN